QWESVLVRVENVTVTNDDLGYGEWSVSDDSGDVIIDDKGSYTYAPVNGDALDAVIGPLDYAYGAFKIQPRDDNDIILPAPPPALVINEFLADPASGLAGDANGDGVRDSGDDEFIEVVNNSDSDVDISGWTLSDGYGVRHTFLEGTVVSANCAVVVFGGGTPTGGFGGAVVQTANGAYNQLGLNNSGDTITLSDGTTDLVVVTYGSEGGDNQSLTRDPDITGEFVKHSEATGSGGALFSPGTMIDGSLFSGCSKPFGACGDPATFIHDIQGSGATSPEVGNVHEIEGVVVGDFQTSEHLSGFFIQEEDTDADADPMTSEGIFVYDGSYPDVDVNVGDVVRVMGEVSEYYDLTELGYISDMAVCGSSSIAPTEVDLPADLEPYEGMLVTLPEELTASQNYFQGRYGQVTMSSEGRLFNPTNIYRPLTPEAIALAAGNMRRMIVLDDGTSSQNVDPIPYIGAYDTLRAGDTVAGLTGVVDYGPINSSYPPARYYRLHPTQEPVEFTRVNERTTAPSDVGGVIKITSFNVLNYFNGDGMGGGFPTSRGADTLDEFNRQRDKIISAIVAMDADVIGLMEIENDGYDQYSAIADLVNGLNDVTGAGTYASIDPGVAPVGTDEIAVGFIYRPDTVSPVGAAAILDSSVDPDFNSDRNRPAIAQTFERSTGGGVFTAVVNHLKSKGSPCDDIGDPDIGDGQGNCNLTRESAAIALTNWLVTDPTGSGDPDFFIIGDLNSYAKEDPIIAIEDADYTNLVEALDGTWAYSYIFDGQAGYLDHALASPSAVPQVMGATVWHINTDEPSVIDYNVEYKSQDLYTPTPYRSSDHDPVVVGFCDAVPPEVEVQVTPDTLWPVNHKYVIVQAIVNATDNLDPNPAVALLSVTSNEPDDGLGDGDTPDDIVIVDDFTFELRAERSGTGDGRIYTITYEVTDACGNSTVATATVTVPHNQG
ncbi:MAG: ExeM/NucH family extracellular endonuclease, partial [Anaerolineae bacterium]